MAIKKANSREQEICLVKAKSRLRWYLLGFAFLATVINYIDRQALSVIAPLLLVQFQISASSYSHIIFFFMLAYTLMNGLSGRLLDRLGSKVGYGLAIAFWSGAEILHAFSVGVLSLGAFRFLLGLGEAGNYPAGVKLIAEWFPAEERSLASGIFNSGASIGAILAAPLLVWILLTAGWRFAFTGIGLLGFLWLAAWVVIYKEPAHIDRNDDAPQASLKSLLRSRFLWQFTISKVFSDPAWYFYTFWLPQYLKVAHGFSMKDIGETAWIPFFTAAIGNLVGGASHKFLMRLTRSPAVARRVAVVLFSLLTASSLFIEAGGNAPTAIALISIATFGYSGALANLLAIPGDVFPKGSVASVWGLASMGSGFGGMIFSLLTGWLIDRYSFRPAFILFGLLPLLAALIVWTLPRQAEIDALTPCT